MKIRESEGQPVVFVVDDDQSLCGALKKLFNMVGLRAETFSAAADFLKIALPDVPACLVLDVRLQGSLGSTSRANWEKPISKFQSSS